ncbi:MAG: nitroreductase family protein [Clostridiales bacterium]|nr:nitroreductase family protein [Clostridiales bacterium]
MQLFEAIEKRHSVRAFRSDTVPREALEKIMRAAALAPSALNEQPWLFYVTSGETRRRVGEIMAQSTTHLEEYVDLIGPERMSEAVRWYSELGNAPVVIVCAMPKADDPFGRLNKQISVGAAIQNVLLAATAIGLAACNITFAFWVRDELASHLGVPKDHEIVTIIALGYSAEHEPVSPPHKSDIAEYLD